MDTIILNMSPKGNSKKSNSKIICEEFVRCMEKPCEIINIANSNLEQTSQYITDFDNIIFALPLYIHAMPGIMMEFIEYLSPSNTKNQSMGFIIQAGFIESAQGKYVERYFELLAKKLDYKYLGTVFKGEAAAIYMFPRMFKKVLSKFNELGKLYEQTHSFDEEIVLDLGRPYELSKFKAHLYQLLCDIGLNNIGWHRMLKKNGAYKKRLDTPFL
ncbi:NAD(P)H dehydrogenase [Clostridiaceae bacterium M8S5]|nr:NAD(P)H dehydrogenase [Clostridiaceae bacterium M8S5]